MPRPRPAAPVLALLLLAAACADAGPPAVADAPLLEARPELRIGSVDDPATMLTRVGAMAVGADGRIHSAHPREDVILVHDAAGARVARLGGPGEGPGEFRSLGPIGLVGDTLWALDRGLYRITYFSPAGDVVRSVKVPIELGGGPGRSPPRPAGVLPDGRLFGASPAWSHMVATGEITETPTVVMDAAGGTGDTLFVREHSVWAVQDPSDPMRFGSFRAQPFTDEPLVAISPAAPGYVVVDRAVRPDDDAPAFRVARVAFGGDTAFSRAFPYDPVPIDPAAPDSLVAAFAAGFREPRFSSAPSEAKAAEWARASLYVPAHHPPVTGLVPGRDGTIWLRREDADPSSAEWLVLDPAGDPIGRVRLPAALRVRAAQRDRVWGWEMDELDVPYIVRYGVAAAGGG